MNTTMRNSCSSTLAHTVKRINQSIIFYVLEHRTKIDTLVNDRLPEKLEPKIANFSKSTFITGPFPLVFLNCGKNRVMALPDS